MNKDSQKEKSNLYKDKQGMSRADLRNNYSMEEIQRLLGDIDAVISSHKAEQKGLHPENMVKTIRGGRVVWITVEEMNTILSKQRRMTNKKFVQRNVRDENSLSSEINRRIDTCRSLIDAIRKVAPEDGNLFINKIRHLEALQNLTISQAREVRILEAAIQRKKQEDPLLREVDNATDEIMTAVNNNQLKDVDVCRSFCDRHMEEYMARQKRLEPYIHKAREFRMAFLVSKQQLFQLEYEIINQGVEILKTHIEEILYYDKEGKDVKLLIDLSEELLALLAQSHPHFLKLSGIPPEQLKDFQSLFQTLETDCLKPLFNKMISFVEMYIQCWRTFVEKRDSEPSCRAMRIKKNNASPKRMAYRDKKEMHGG